MTRTPATQATRDMHDRWTRRYLDHPSPSATTENTNHQQKASTMQAPSAPTSGDKLDLKALNGQLLHITVGNVVKGIETSFGVTDAIQADIVVLSGDQKGEELTDTLIFPKVLQSQLAQHVGAADPVILARLGQGIAKPGKSAPWVLNPPTAEDLAVGQKYEAYAADDVEPF